MKRSFLPVDRISQEPYSAILGYPRATKKQLALRVAELEKLGISGVSFDGSMTIGTINVLGKGYAGIVVLAKRGTKKVALKIRRTDSPRKTMEQETMLLQAANKVGVGPTLLHSSKNFIVMEYLDGKKIFDWISELGGDGSTAKLKSVIKKVLSDCYRLDMIGLDHGELSNITKHVIVGKSIKMIDFESSSLERRVSNVTSATQAIFIGSGLAKIVQKIYKVPPRPKIISVLREYKEHQTQQSFDNVLKTLKL
ncbi:MAG: serine/threonine protein kinase [Candidatus Nitrosotenuis sp.]|nr:MAG: serine/threonine protein kinase [Candidatus Nitrosotenuis sp.]